MQITRLAAVPAMLILSGGALAQPVSYGIHRAGLYGPEYTSNTGTRSVTASRLSQSGLFAGRSERRLGTATGYGFATWLYEDGGTARIGYFDAAHTASRGDQNSSIVGINASGTVAGTSTRYVGTQTGASAWYFRNGAITRVGFTGGGFTSSTGLQASSVAAINNAGQIAGYSTQFVSASESLPLPWSLDQGVYTVLGLTDAAHTRSDGFRSGWCVALNEAGDIAGHSGHYSGVASLGNSGWVRHAGVTMRVGLTDGVFTAADGTQYTNVFGLTADGRAVGTSDDYLPSGVSGTAMWIADGLGTTRIGLFDANHTSSTGQQLCYPQAVSTNGNVIGRAFRYAGGQGSNGESAWLFSGGANVRIGLIGPGYVGTNGFEYSQAQFVNDRGEVLGNSTINMPQWSGGPAVWIYRGGQTIRIGLFDSVHTNPSSGFQSSMAIQLNARGDAIGTSARYVGPLIYTEGWYYDRATDSVVPLRFSVATGGDASSSPMMLTDDGVVYGQYSRYSGSQFVGSFLFRWSMAGGMEELAPLVQGGIAGAGWDNINAVYSSGVPGTWDHTTIVGLGRLAGETQNSIFVLSPVAGCGSADFNCDGDGGTDTDIEAFFACLAGSCPAFPCTSNSDFNGDADPGTDADIEAFFRVLAGGTC
jgi:hypothetical protein